MTETDQPAARLPRVKRQTTAKRGREPAENEDSSAENVAQGRFSISDGASTAARSEVWSRLLTSAFVHGDDPLDLDVLSGLRRAWWMSVFDEDLAWFAREKLSQGSAATFLGLWINGDRYGATAVGDSCLFHISNEELVLAAPLDDWTQFSRFPNLVSTNANADLTPEQIWSAEGKFVEGDVFVLATDALAKHVLRTYALDGVVPPICDHVDDDTTFVEFIERERKRGLENDDSTVCVVLT